MAAVADEAEAARGPPRGAPAVPRPEGQKEIMVSARYGFFPFFPLLFNPLSRRLPPLLPLSNQRLIEMNSLLRQVELEQYPTGPHIASRLIHTVIPRRLLHLSSSPVTDSSNLLTILCWFLVPFFLFPNDLPGDGSRMFLFSLPLIVSVATSAISYSPPIFVWSIVLHVNHPLGPELFFKL